MHMMKKVEVFVLEKHLGLAMLVKVTLFSITLSELLNKFSIKVTAEGHFYVKVQQIRLSITWQE